MDGAIWKRSGLMKSSMASHDLLVTAHKLLEEFRMNKEIFLTFISEISATDNKVPDENLTHARDLT
jgi:hypothetical protein